MTRQPAPALGPRDDTRAAKSPLADIRPFGKYFLVKKLAEGGMAEIFLAKHIGAEGFERDVVIKRMLPHVAAVPDLAGMFFDEARLAAKLAHPNIVQIHDLGVAEGDGYFICMEYLAGEDFSLVLRTASKRKQYVPLEIVLRVIADAAQGLHYAHEFVDDEGRPLNIVHRDVSPSNIYVTYQGQVKLLDFGVAKAESRLSRTTAGVVKGKYMYMAPEQAQSDGKVDRRADIFSLGVSLYEAVTNTRPFARDTDLAVLAAVLQCEFRAPRALRPELYPEVEAIILRAMSKDPARRYQTAAELADDVELVLSGLPLTASGASGLATYLRSFFGEERFNERTRIPSIAAMNAVPPPQASASPFERLAIAVDPASTDKTGLLAPLTAMRSARRRWPLVLGAVVGGALLATGVGVLFFPREPRPPPARASGESSEVAEAAEVAEVAEVAEGGAASSSSTPAEVRPVRPAPPAKLAPLTLGEVERVVRARRSAITRCFEQHKEELPSEKGEVRVEFAIDSAGRVIRAKADVPSSVVAGCLESRIRQLRFPRHVDQEVSLTLPFTYEIARGGARPP